MDRVQGNVVYDNGLVRIDDAQLSIGSGNAKVKGQYVVDTGDFDAVAMFMPYRWILSHKI